MEAARRFGHSNGSITTTHYARAMKDGDLAVAEMLDGLRSAAPAAGDRDVR